MDIQPKSQKEWQHEFRVKSFARALIGHNFDFVRAGRESGLSNSHSDKKVGDKARKFFKHPDVQAEISAVAADRLEAAEITVDRTLAEIKGIAYRDPAGYFKDGQTVRMDQLPVTLRKSIAEIKVANNGDVTWKLESKAAALSLLSKHLGIAKEKVEHEVAGGGELADLFKMVKQTTSERSTPT